MTTTTTNYDRQAKEVLKTIGARMTIKLSNTKKAQWDEGGDSMARNHYRVKLSTKIGSYTFDFWGSIADYEKGKDHVSGYDVLACLEYYTPEKFEDFCSEFGYDTDSIKARETWKRCLHQTRALNRILTADQIQILKEVQ